MSEELQVDMCSIQGTMNEFTCIWVISMQGRVITAASVASNNYLSIQQVNSNVDILYIQVGVKDMLLPLYR